jgi:hypothetical protein
MEYASFLTVVVASDTKEFATIENLVAVALDVFAERNNVALYFLDVAAAPMPMVTLPVLLETTDGHNVPVVASGLQMTPGSCQNTDDGSVVLLIYESVVIVTSVLKYSVASGRAPPLGMQVYSVKLLYMTETFLVPAAACSFTP